MNKMNKKIYESKKNCNGNCKCKNEVLKSNGETVRKILDIGTSAMVEITKSDLNDFVKTELLKGVERFQSIYTETYLDAIDQFLKCISTLKCKVCKGFLSSLQNVTIGLYNQNIQQIINVIFPIDIDGYYSALTELYRIEFSIIDCEYVAPPPPPPPPVLTSHITKLSKKNNLKMTMFNKK